MAIIGGTYVKIPSGSIPSTLTDFVVKVDLSDLTDSFWNNVDAAGAYIRVKNSAGTDIPFDLVSIDTVNKKGLLFFKSTLTAGQTNEFRVAVDNAVSAPAVTDPIGRNAVYSDYDGFYVGSAPSVNRTGAATTQANLSAGTASLGGYLPFSPPVDVHQGIAFDGSHYYLIDTTAIYKFDLQWKLVASNTSILTTLRTASGYSVLDHLGDGTIKDGELYIVVEQYPATPYDSQIVAVINVSDLSYNRLYDISAQAHEVSSICFDATNGYFVITDYTTTAGNTVLHKYSTSFAYLGTITMPSLTNKQGIEYMDGYFWISRASLLYRLNLDGTNLTTAAVYAPNSGGGEGLCAKGDGTLLVLFDGTPSMVHQWVPNATLATMYPNWLNTLSTAPFRSSGLPKRTAWTMGVSVVPLMDSSTAALLSYSDNSTTSANRATMGMRSTTNYGVWNSTDSWLDDVVEYRHLNAIGVRRRLTHTFNGTTDRKIWKDGRLEATDNTVSQRPAGTGDTLFVGVEDSTPGERFMGLMNYVYLRNGVMSADWLFAEYMNWDRGGFYSTSDNPDSTANLAALDNVIGSDTDPGSGASGWTKYNVSDYATSARGTGITGGPAYGSRFFRADAGLTAFAYQDIDVTSLASRIDHGDVNANMVYSIVSDASDNDAGFVYLEFYDATDTLIKRIASRRADLQSTAAWLARTHQASVPRRTRKIRRAMYGERSGGTDLNIGWDISELRLTAPLLGSPVTGHGRRQILVH